MKSALARIGGVSAVFSVLACTPVAQADVGIGTEQPDARLHVVGETAQTGRDLRIEHLDTPHADDTLRFVVTDQDGFFHAASADDLGIGTDSSNPPITRGDDDWRPSQSDLEMTIDSAIFTNNRVGIGVTVPAYELDIDGDIRATGSLFASNHVITHATFATSDQRFKRDIEDYSDGLAHVRALQPKRFRYTNDAPVGATDQMFYGLIAQEAALVDPNLVQSFALPTLAPARLRTDANTARQYLGVDSQRLIFTLISAVKALDAKDREVDTLRARLDDLEARLLAPQQDCRVDLSTARNPSPAPQASIFPIARPIQTGVFSLQSFIPLQPKEFF